MKNVGLYIRVSTEHQVKEGYSISAQKNNLAKFAASQGWNIFDIYADEGISGKNIKDRPEVKRLIKDIRDGKIDIVLLYKFDRLTRDSRDTEDIILLVQECGIQVFTLSGGVVDVSTASGRFSVRINGAVAQLEREQTIERVKVAFRQKVEEGYTLATSRICYGYDRKIHDKNQTINIKEAKVVKRIFEMYNTGKSLTEICNILNMEKVPTKMCGKKTKKNNKNQYNTLWMPKTLKLILTNPTYIGKVRYHIGKNDYFEANGNHKAIISKELWDETQNRINKVKHISKTRFAKEDAYFCGILFCGVCGHKMTTSRTIKKNKANNKVIFNNYRCINREKKTCNCIGISHNKLEKRFVEYLDTIESFELDSDKIEFKLTDKENKIDTLKKMVQKINYKSKKIMNLFMLDKLSEKQFKYMINELNEKTMLFNNEITNLENMNIDQKDIINNIPKTIKEIWLSLSDAKKMNFLHNFIERIEVINRGRKGKITLKIKFCD